MKDYPPDLPRLDDHDERMEVAREMAEWQLGSASWAGILIGAYLYPRANAEAITRDKEMTT